MYIYINYYYIYRHGKSKLFHIYSARSRRSGPGKKLRRSGLVVMLPPTHLEAWEIRQGAVEARGGLKLIINGHIKKIWDHYDIYIHKYKDELL
jgi:hypothetical protein